MKTVIGVALCVLGIALASSSCRRNNHSQKESFSSNSATFLVNAEPQEFDKKKENDIQHTNDTVVSNTDKKPTEEIPYMPPAPIKPDTVSESINSPSIYGQDFAIRHPDGVVVSKEGNMITTTDRTGETYFLPVEFK